MLKLIRYTMRRGCIKQAMSAHVNMTITFPHAANHESDLTIVQFEDRRRDFLRACILAKQTKFTRPDENSWWESFVCTRSINGVCAFMNSDCTFHIFK